MRTLVPEKDRGLANRAADANARRAREIVASLRVDEPADVFEAFWQLDSLPIDDVRDALVAWTGPLPDVDRLDTARRLALGLPLRPLRLRALSVATDADILDLGPVAEEQLRLAGKSWDGAELAAEDRLDGERDDSFAGTVERRVLADAEAPGDTPVFDVLLFAEDSGVVFAAGTTNVVALIAYRKVEMRDRRTRIALEEALTPVEVVPPSGVVALAEVQAEETSVAAPIAKRRSAAAKPVAKKTAARKAAVKQASTRKPAAKKTTAEMATVKKTTAKKATVKKTTTKKPAAKKATAKKPAAKKAIAKKPAVAKTAKKAVKNAATKSVVKKKSATRGTLAAKGATRKPKG